MASIGTRKVYEDDRVIVWYLDLEPGEETRRHTHKLDYVARIISGSQVEAIGPDGESLYIAERQSGDAISFRVEGNQVVSDVTGATPVPATHSARNVGATVFQEVIIEFKR